MAYPFGEIEKKWQKHWADHKTFRAENKSDRPKYYALDMFPYPSGAGLHVGHPLGYIATDIVSRYKRLKGFNVLHPMGYDSFGLPAEQYAIQTGQHPKKTTEDNIARYRQQMDKIGFSFDWDREVQTSDPNYYKWTQWIFLKLFNSWYNPKTDKAESLDTLIPTLKNFNSLSEKEKSDVLMEYRLAYLSEAWVNWCPQLGTVLANEEVKDGVSERGGYPVERKLMPQWSLRITAYADRLLKDLDGIEWTESIKEAQRNWIGKSEGSSLKFQVSGSKLEIEVFTTRPDTIFGVTFLTLAPESELVPQLTTPENKKAVDEYVHFAKNRSERERQADVKKITGQFTGAYAIHPFSQKQIPIWIGDYVLAGYGTGAVMAVPGHDSRDYAFAKHFDLPILEVVAGGDLSKESYDAKEGKLVNSDFLNGLDVKEAVKKAIAAIEAKGLGKGKTQFRLRDAIFGRQRYWGEPIPVYYKDGIPVAMEESELPLVLPEVDKYLPTEDGEPPLARARDWKHQGKYEYEKTTMPGWAGSSWYYLRYMDPQNKNEFASKEAISYWKDVDLYIGGSEHSTGHLLYVRFWTKFLYDLNLIPIIEPAKKLINQGMIQGMSAFIYRLAPLKKSNISIYFPQIFVSKNTAEKIIATKDLSVICKAIQKHNLGKDLKDLQIELSDTLGENGFLKYQVNIDSVTASDFLDLEHFKREDRGRIQEFSEFICDDDSRFGCIREVEKMSKSKRNVVTPDDICTNFGADTLRLYEMFLGPLEQSKPWSTAGISGVAGFLNRFWRLFHTETKVSNIELREDFKISEEEPTKAELKVLHKTIKKIQVAIETYSFNTAVSTFMIATNDLMDLKCNKRAILEPITILLSSFAPHIAEELWEKLGHKKSITFAEFPAYKEEYTQDDSFAYPVSFNGKMRFNLELPLSLTPEQIEKEVLANEQSKKYLEGKQPKKVIVVPKRIVNIVM